MQNLKTPNNPSPNSSDFAIEEEEKKVQLYEKLIQPGQEIDQQNIEDEDGAAVDEPVDKPAKKQTKWEIFLNYLRMLFPSNAIFYMYLLLVAVCIFSFFHRTLKGEIPSVVFYFMYLGGSLLILLIVLISRVFIKYCILHFMYDFSSLFIRMVIYGLDPDIYYLIFSVVLVIFWDNIIMQRSKVFYEDSSLDKHVLSYNIQFLNSIVSAADLPIGDIKIIRVTEIILVLFSLRGVLANLVLLFFLKHFLNNVNYGVLQHLSIYSLVKQLIINWSKLNGLKNAFCHENSKDSINLKNAKSKHHLRHRAYEKLQEMKSKAFNASEMHHPQKTVFQRFFAKKTSENSENKQVDVYLTDEFLLDTSKDGYKNLLALDFIHNHIPVVTVDGVTIKISSIYIARLVGKKLFDDFVAFRNFLCPDTTLNAYQRDVIFKKAVLDKLGVQSLKDFDVKSFELKEKKKEEINEFKNTKNYITKLFELPIVTRSFSSDEKPTGLKNSKVVDKSQPKKTTINHKPSRVYTKLTAQEKSHILEKVNAIDKPTMVDPSLSKNVTGIIFQSESRSDSDKKEPVTLDGPAVRLHKQTVTQKHQPNRCFSREFFSMFVIDGFEKFMYLLDPSGRKIVYQREFEAIIEEIFRSREQVLILVNSQDGIQKVFHRLVSGVFSCIMVLVLLVVLGVSLTTIMISGAAAFSSITVSLSVIYTNFIQSVIFVCFINPYDVGNRIRIDNDNLYVVNKITTFYTEMFDVHGRLVYWTHSLLSTMNIKNESRWKHAGLELHVSIAYDTPPSKYEALHQFVEDFIQTTPNYVKNSFFCFVNNVEVGHFIRFTYWCSCVDSWHNWKSVWNSRGKLIQLIIRKCKELEIHYKLPILPAQIKNSQYLPEFGNKNAGFF